MSTDVEEGAAPEAAPKKRGRGKLLLFIALPLLLLIGGGAGAYFSGALDSLLGKNPASEETGAELKPREALFVDLPDMLVNLNTGSRKPSFLKVDVSLQLGHKEDEDKVKLVQPRIIDTFQTYMRELRPEDLKGSAGLYRLREELLIRVNATVSPVKVDDVLFRDLLVQ